MDEANCAKWCLILLVGRSRHFAREIGLGVTYLVAFRGGSKWVNLALYVKKVIFGTLNKSLWQPYSRKSAQLNM